MARPFRFGTAVFGNHVTSREDLAAFAQKVEALGYSTLATGQRLSSDIAGPAGGRRRVCTGRRPARRNLTAEALLIPREVGNV